MKKFGLLAALLFAYVFTAASCEKAEKKDVYIEVPESERIESADEITQIAIEGEREISAERYAVIRLNATIGDGTEIVWESSNDSVAEVDENGAVFCKSAGTAVITARKKTNKSVSDGVLIKVLPKVEEVSEDIFDE